MPPQKPGRSRQNYATPPDLMAAVAKRFGTPTWDLAASPTNTKAPKFITREQNTLRTPWPLTHGPFWLNPPFADINPYARKCYAWSLLTKEKILFLTPASFANWFIDWVDGKAHVLGLSPRVAFIGQDAYPKDLFLSVYNEPPGFEIWKWK